MILEEQNRSEMPYKKGKTTTIIYDSASLFPSFFEEILEIWRYRYLIIELVKRDLKVRYKRSILGILWTMLNPLMMMIILTLVFSHLFRFDLEKYPIYLLSGLIVWNFFSQTTSYTMNHFMWSGALFKQIYFPRSSFAFSSVGAGLVNFFVSFILLLIIIVILGGKIKFAIICTLFSILLIALFALGISLFLSSFSITFPDIIEMYQVLLMGWYFITPIFYPKSILPKILHKLLIYNPIFPLIEIFRSPLYYGHFADLHLFLLGTIYALGSLLFGWWFFTYRIDKIITQI